MQFMKYSNENQVNIIPQEEFEGLIMETFHTICDNITKSLGPLGSSATILDGMLTEATKDGYSILMKYRFHNRYKKMIYNLIKAPCIRMNNIVGDGTTTSIALANAIFDRYQDRKGVIETLYRLPRQFTKAWDEVVEDICGRIRARAIPIDPEDYNTIYNLAYVTSNGNEEISKAIAETYREAKSPAIKQKDSPTNKSYIKAIEGFEFPANAIDVVYVRNQDLTAEEKDVAVMIFDHKIETDFFNKVLIQINEVLRAMGKKLIVVAPAYDEYMCDTVLKQYVNYECSKHGVINMILTQYRLGNLTPHQTEDLAVVLRGRIITEQLAETIVNRVSENNIDQIVESIMENNEYDLYRMIGQAAKVFTSCKNGCIFNVDNINDDPEYQEALTRANNDLKTIIEKTDYEKQSYASKIYEARSRVMQLEMKNYIYYVGADSDLQKQILWDSIEDVIKCLRSAIKCGSVPGCQLTIAKVCLEALEENYVKENPLKVEIINLIYCAVVDVYMMILHGASGLGIIKTIPGWNSNSEDLEAAIKDMKKLTDSYNGEDKVEKLAIAQAKIEETRRKDVATIKKLAVDKCQKIVNTSIERMEVFDLENLEYSGNIITSAETDELVLTVASELIKVLISGNQCIFLDSDINESHQETMEI